ncbi:MAG TPA: flagellin, partial [Steroidobacteraceae bacterium]|nr:flagellin [Steroidobacteraceae bacterium]
MSLVINTNVASINAQNNLTSSKNALATSLQRLSSGLRINSAKDDAAGLAIATRFTTQINGLDQAARNANDAISLSQTAEGALGEYTNNLQRIRELAVQSANSTNSSTDRAALNNEVQQLLAELNRTATRTQFNGQNILDGSFSSAQFQVGANANQTISVSIGNASTTALGAYQFNNNGLNPVSGSALASGDLTINGVNVGTSISGSADDIVNAINGVTSQTAVTASATSSIVAANSPVTGAQALQSGDLVINGVNIGPTSSNNNFAAQGAAIATAINNKTASTGVSATANAVTGAITLSSSTGKTIAITTSNGAAGASRVENATGLELSASTATATQTFTVGGAKGISTITFAATIVDGDTFTLGGKTFEFSKNATTGSIINGTHVAIGNGNIAWTATLASAGATTAIGDATNGVSTVVATDGGAGALTVTSKVIGVEAVKSYLINDTGLNGHTTAGATEATAASGIAENATFTLDGTNYTFITGLTSGNNISITQTGNNATAQGSVATALAAAISNNHTPLVASTNTSSHTATASGTAVTASSVLKGTAGNALATGITGLVVAAGVVASDGTYTASTTYGTISLNSNSAYQVGGNNPNKAGLATAGSTLQAISTIDISSVTGANSAISLVDGALSQISTIRAQLGAVQNRFQSTINSLSTASQNLNAARSAIQDADFAAETANLT